MRTWFRRAKAFAKIRRGTFGQRNAIQLGRMPPSSLSFHVFGNDNTVSCAAGIQVDDLAILIRGSGNLIEIEEGVILESCRIEVWARDGRIRIGKNTRIMGACLIVAESNTGISLGEGCLIATGVEFRTGDGHAIHNKATGARTNPGASIRVGDRVWLAKDVLVLKGAVIPDGSVVGARSTVTKDLPEANGVYAGSPATLKRSGICWGYSLDEAGRLSGKASGATLTTEPPSPENESSSELNLTRFPQ